MGGEVKRRAPCEIGNATFGISPYGWGKYRFCLDHQMARIGFSTSRYLPTVRIQPRAEYLHAIGPEAVVSSLQETLGPQLGQLRFGVSRVDLFSDWQGWSLTLEDAHRFVCRAQEVGLMESYFSGVGGGTPPASEGCNPVHLIVYEVEPPICSPVMA